MPAKPPARGLAPLLVQWIAPLAILVGVGCQPGPSVTYGTAGTGAGSSGSTGGGSTSAGASSSGSTGAPNPPSPYVDGGYVFCTLPSAADAGPFGDGGPATWLCLPGLTFCDPGGDIGGCFQCRTDADCADPLLPGYDPRRPRCDQSSGVPGYQGFCQQCLGSADCAGNAAGTLCDLNPVYPAGALVSNLEIGGFEACGTLVTDCRLDGGPLCNGPNQICDSDSGLCATRSTSCATDADCAGLLFFYLPIPYCQNGGSDAGFCTYCDGGLCGDEGCTSNADYKCACGTDAECGAFWPICEGTSNGGVDAGAKPGQCGCDADFECGDGGLRCLPRIANPDEGPGAFCGVPCTSPLFPPCVSLSRDQPICDESTGLCVACDSDEECQASPQAGGPSCLNNGACGCEGEPPCPAGETCQPQQFDFDRCAAALPRCVRGSCPQGFFCNWDSGACEPPGSCLADSDCGFSQLAGPTTTPFCDAGQCAECRASSDCLKVGEAARGKSACANGACTDTCDSDQICVGNATGPVCVEHSGNKTCGCAGDLDCAGNAAGPWCDTDAGDSSFGSCGCFNNADCGPGQFCHNRSPFIAQCAPGCNADSDCPPSTYCDPRSTCRPRCDNGHICIGTDLFCDHGDIAVQNGAAHWCYECLSGDDCEGTAGCNSQSCGVCADTSECATGRVCVGGSCQPRCSHGACADGELCDTLGVGGYGPDVCFSCVTAADCSDGLGCNQHTHVCGTCWSPNDPIVPQEGFDCPPGDVCSSTWQREQPQLQHPGQTGVCLASCDLRSCPASQPLCEAIPSLGDHRYCVNCLHDSDCADAGHGAWCDVSVNFTFSCQPGGV